MRHTSTKAYHEIRDNGLLSKMRFKVYEAVYKYGPITGVGLNRLLKTPSAHKRLSELEAAGVIEIVGEKKTTTGHMGILWDVTKALPKKVSRKKVRPPLPSKVLRRLRELSDRVEQLETENVDLRAQLLQKKACRRKEAAK